MSHYHHLTISERESIWESVIKGKTVRQIARETGRSASTISREIKRNRCAQSYRPSEAQEAYQKRRQRCKRRLILEQGDLRNTVVRLISSEQWSPEQIAKRLELEHGAPVVSYSTIYRALSRGYMEPKGKKRRNRHGRYSLQKHLRRKGWRGKGKKAKPQTHIHQTIDERPKEVDARDQFGHWEGDLVYSSFHKVYIVTMVERVSRFLITGVCKTKQPEQINATIIAMMKQLPQHMLRTITLDRGTEFTMHHDITNATGAEIYFAHPRAPWERGTNENTNGLLRQYVPKHTYKVPFSEDLLRDFTEKLNRRPRKCLDWKSPFECFFHKVLHLT